MRFDCAARAHDFAKKLMIMRPPQCGQIHASGEGSKAPMPMLMISSRKTPETMGGKMLTPVRSPSTSRCKNMAAIEGRKSVAQSRPRRQIPKRHRGHQNAGSPRRLIDLVTQSPAYLSRCTREMQPFSQKA